jgi:hypothetical protein
MIIYIYTHSYKYAHSIPVTTVSLSPVSHRSSFSRLTKDLRPSPRPQRLVVTRRVKMVTGGWCKWWLMMVNDRYIIIITLCVNNQLILDGYIHYDIGWLISVYITPISLWLMVDLSMSILFWLVVSTLPPEKWWSSSDWIIFPTKMGKMKKWSKPLVYDMVLPINL